MAEDIAAYEKLGAFYLGRPRDAAGAVEATPLLYDSRDLLTHAVCVGMTGSGKTGLLISLLEEAAIDHIPALVIDPKGDLSNLLLTFPELRPADFAPWIDPDAAARAGLTPEAFAAKEAETWRNGLAKWDQSGERIARLRDAADFAIYTPGSEAGLQISILSSLDAPPPEVIADGDALRERVGTLVASLLALLGVDSDPIQRAREHPAVEHLRRRLARGARARPRVADPADPEAPDRAGRGDGPRVLLSRPRTASAWRWRSTTCSARPASRPGCAASRSTSTACSTAPSGKPRIAIFSIAHLSDRERMFFVSLLLNQTLGWMRRQAGHQQPARPRSCMDEVFGYMPPVAEPPSKRPMLTLLKQARAFGARPRARHPEPGGPRLQGALQRRHLVPRPPADRARQGSG